MAKQYRKWKLSKKIKSYNDITDKRYYHWKLRRKKKFGRNRLWKKEGNFEEGKNKKEKDNKKKKDKNQKKKKDKTTKSKNTGKQALAALIKLD